jgi:TRAP-type C4-dicarboxylate transport system substrate-binding protein
MHITGMSDVFEFSTVPGLVRTLDENQYVVESVIQPYMREWFADEFNTEILAMNGQHVWMVALKKKVEDFSDFKGIKLPVRNALQMDFWERFGGVPITVPFTELMTALKTGLCDGAATNADNLLKLGFYEEAPYFYNIPMGAAIHTVLMNKDSMAKLPDDLQTLIRDEFAKGQAEYHAYNVARDTELNNEISEKATLVELPRYVDREVEEKVLETAQAWLNTEGRSDSAIELYNLIVEAKKGM